MSSEPSDAAAGMDRRRFLLGTTAATAGLWVAPSILTIDRALGATGSPMGGCDTTAFDVRGQFSNGPVIAVINPIRECNNTGGGSLVQAFQIGPFGTAQTSTVMCSTAPCSASAEVAGANLIIGGIPVTASILRANATCTGGTTTGGSSVADVRVGTLPPVSGTQSQTLTVGPLTVFINERMGDTFNALRISLVTTLQTVDITIASATAAC